MHTSAAPTLLSALDDIRAERLALRSGGTSRIVSLAEFAKMRAKPAIHRKSLNAKGYVTPRRFASRLRIRNWQRAFYLMSLVGTFLGFVGGWWVLGGEFPDRLAGFTMANAASPYDRTQQAKSTLKEDRLTQSEVFQGQRRCSEVIYNAKLGVTFVRPCGIGSVKP